MYSWSWAPGNPKSRLLGLLWESNKQHPLPHLCPEYLERQDQAKILCLLLIKTKLVYMHSLKLNPRIQQTHPLRHKQTFQAWPGALKGDKIHCWEQLRTGLPSGLTPKEKPGRAEGTVICLFFTLIRQINHFTSQTAESLRSQREVRRNRTNFPHGNKH